MFFSSNQLYSFCLILFFGIICAIFNGFLGIFLLKNHQKNIFNFIFKLILSLIFSIFLIFSINIFYFGQFNLIIISAFILGYIWCTKTISNLLDFLEIKFYHICIKVCKLVKFYFVGRYESIKD